MPLLRLYFMCSRGVLHVTVAGEDGFPLFLPAFLQRLVSFVEPLVDIRQDVQILPEVVPKMHILITQEFHAEDDGFCVSHDVGLADEHP